MGLDVEAHYLRYGPMVLRRCRALLRNEARAEEAMHDVFVSVLRFEERLSDEAPGALLHANRHQRLPEPAAGRSPPPRGRRTTSWSAGSPTPRVRRGRGARRRGPGRATCSASFSPRRSAGRLDPVAGGHAPRRRHDPGRGRARVGAVGLGRAQAAARAARPARGAGRSLTMSERQKKTPDWMIERLALGELDAATAEAVRAQLRAEGRSPEEALAAIAASNRARSWRRARPRRWRRRFSAARGPAARSAGWSGRRWRSPPWRRWCSPSPSPARCRSRR